MKYRKEKRRDKKGRKRYEKMNKESEEVLVIWFNCTQYFLTDIHAVVLTAFPHCTTFRRTDFVFPHLYLHYD
jgi:hypothetical protein